MKRVLTGCVALPLLLVIILFLPHLHYLAFCIVALLACLIGSYEIHAILIKDNHDKLALPPWCGSLLLVVTYIEYAYLPHYNLILYALIFLISLVFTIETIKGGKDNFHLSRERMATSITQIIYPNLFGVFFIRFAFLENAWLWLLTFLLFVFSSDTFAYLFGILFGKNNKNIVKVSPNKSVAGFIAGAFVPALEGALLTYFASIYGLTWYQGFLLGFCTAIAGILGDLIESAFKRSANVKDSGTIIPGRGGIMDSIDSLVMAAPIFICLIHFILN